jgi:hypothetical protein
MGTGNGKPMSSASARVRDLPGVRRDLRLSELLRVSLPATVGIEFADPMVIRLDRSAPASFPSLHYELENLTRSAAHSDDRRGRSGLDSPHMKSLVKEVRAMAKAKKAKKGKKSPKKGK